jgi:hypothetical protein
MRMMMTMSVPIPMYIDRPPVSVEVVKWLR